MNFRNKGRCNLDSQGDPVMSYYEDGVNIDLNSNDVRIEQNSDIFCKEFGRNIGNENCRWSADEMTAAFQSIALRKPAVKSVCLQQ